MQASSPAGRKPNSPGFPLTMAPAIAARVNRLFLFRGETIRVAVLLLASILPALALWSRATYLFGDSYQYLRAGFTFAQGQGFRDMSGNQFTFLTPLYSLFTGIAYALIPGVGIITIARLVSLIGATGAVTAFYWLLRGRFSVRVAFVASLLFALMPLRVWSSLWVLSEGLYLGLLMLGVALLLRGDSISGLRGLLGGVVFGLTYLTRPESILYLAGIVVLTLIGAVRSRRRKLVPALIMAGFLAIALPYHAWVRHVSDSPASGRLNLLFD